MNTEIKIIPHNMKPHLDIARDMLKKKTGLFSFVLRINAGKIVDYVKQEIITARRTG